MASNLDTSGYDRELARVDRFATIQGDDDE